MSPFLSQDDKNTPHQKKKKKNNNNNNNNSIKKKAKIVVAMYPFLPICAAPFCPQNDKTLSH